MADEYFEFYFGPRRGEIVNVLLSGVITSAAAVLLAWAASTYLIGGVFCGQSTEGLCAAPLALGYNIFLILGAMASTGWFAYSRIYRPALITLPSAIILWSLPVAFANLLAQDLLLFGLINVLLVAFSYLVFYWVVRVRNFLAVFALWLLLTLGMRFLLVA